jgi:hypothetical protein
MTQPYRFSRTLRPAAQPGVSRLDAPHFGKTFADLTPSFMQYDWSRGRVTRGTPARVRRPTQAPDQKNLT